MAQFPSTTSASGVWTLKKQKRAQQGGNWPPAVVPDPYFDYTTLLLHGDGTNGAQNNTFLDSSTNNFTITRNGNTTQGSFSPYGNLWSNYFDGSGDYLSSTSTSIGNFGTGDFTVEFWFNAASLAEINQVDCRGTAGTGDAIRIGLNGPANGNKVRAGWGTNNDLLVSTTVAAIGTWIHVAVTRSGTTGRLFINGTQEASVTSSTSLPDNGLIVASYKGTTAFFSGYISNLRIVKGTALYTSNFTPSATPLTAVSGTSLLTCQSNRFKDNSSNNFTLTPSGNVAVSRFSPFAPTAAYSAVTIGGSGYFDGSGDYLTAPSSTDFDFQSFSNYTYEAFVYVQSLATNNAIFAKTDAGASVGNDYEAYLNTSGNVVFRYWNGSAQTLTTSGTVPVNAWTHLAFVYSSGTLKIYINGSQSASASIVGTLTKSSVPFSIGGTRNGTAGTVFLNGYLSNIRVVKGTAVYTSNFTPPTAPLTAVSGTSLLLNFTNAGIYDNAMMNNLETVGNAQVSTTQKKFGTGSMYLANGNNDYITAPQSAAWQFGTGDYTVECWIYKTSATTGLGDMLACGNTNSNSWYLSIYGGKISIGTVGAFPFLSGTTTINLNTWYHVAVTRSSGTVRVFVNGTQEGSTTNTTDYSAVVLLSIGSNKPLDANWPYYGHIDDLRITKGIARYTANFTPPTAPFPDQ